MNETEPILNMNEITKQFPGVLALDAVSMDVYPHEIVGLVGENGAGKSTLMKILMGIYRPDKGKIVLNEKELMFESPKDAKAHGLGMVFQEQSVLNNLTVYENLFLGHEEVFKKGIGLSIKDMQREAGRMLEIVELDDIDHNYLLFELSFMQRQMVEIARNIWLSEECDVENPIIILDEPTTVLEQRDVAVLFEKLRDLKRKISIIYISHRLREVVDLCDRVYVLKDGKNAGCFKHEEVSEDLLRVKMVGKEFHGEYYLVSEQRNPMSKVVLELNHCSKKGAFKDISLKLHEGEIVSISGAVGSGKEQLCKCIYGLDAFSSGTMFIEGRERRIRSPVDAFTSGIGYIPEDRRNEGLVLDLPIYENITLPIIDKLRRFLFVQQDEQAELSAEMVKKLQIKAPSVYTLCLNLSGGNQQKVVMAKWLLSMVKVIIMIHPTRGVDVGAKHEIYAFIRKMADEGKAMLLIGDSFEEEIGMANNIVVMRDGVISAVLEAQERKPTPNEIIEYLV